MPSWLEIDSSSVTALASGIAVERLIINVDDLLPTALVGLSLRSLTITGTRPWDGIIPIVSHLRISGGVLTPAMAKSACGMRVVSLTLGSVMDPVGHEIVDVVSGVGITLNLFVQEGVYRTHSFCHNGVCDKMPDSIVITIIGPKVARLAYNGEIDWGTLDADSHEWTLSPGEIRWTLDALVKKRRVGPAPPLEFKSMS